MKRNMSVKTRQCFRHPDRIGVVDGQRFTRRERERERERESTLTAGGRRFGGGSRRWVGARVWRLVAWSALDGGLECLWRAGEEGGGCVTSHRGYFSENLETNVVGR
jgi:hypothetical protein